MSLIQLRAGSRSLLRLFLHLKDLLQRVDKAGGRNTAASQAACGNKLYFDTAIRQWSHNTGCQFYLDNGMQVAMAGNAIKVDERGTAVLGICNAALGRVGRGSL